MHFLTPEWLYALILIPLLAILAILTRRSQTRAWKSLVAPRLAKKLIHKAPSARHWIALTLALFSFSCIIVALARPYQGEHTTHERVESRNILVAIDTSKSMLCEDISSNRLTAAKSLSLQMLDRFPTDRIGVLIFAGSSNVIAPLTVDHIAVHDTISQLDTHSIPVGGSNLADAVLLGVETLAATGKRANALVIFSDGEEHDSGVEEAIEKANKAGVQIITIGVGTPAGGIIPSGKESDGKHRNTKGEVVHTKLHESLLQELASKTNGAYTSINNRPDAVITSTIHKMKSFEQEGRAQIIPHERYYWFIIPAVVFALLSAFARARWRGQTAFLALILGFLSLSSMQVEAQESWFEQQKHQLFTGPADEKRGYKALKEENYKAAIDAFSSARKNTEGEKHAQLSSALGQALYRNGDYKAASKAFSKAMLSEKSTLQAEAEYNLGNALFKDQWSEFKGIGDSNFKDYLVQRLQNPEAEDKLTQEDLVRYEKSFANSLEKFQASESTISQQNAKTSQEFIETIQEVRKALDQQQKKEEEEKDGEEENKGGDEEKDGDEKKGEEDKKDADQEKDGDEKNDGDQGKDGEQEKDGEPKKDGEDGDQQKDADQKKDGDEGKDGAQKDGENQGKDGDPKKDQQGQPAGKPDKKSQDNGYAIKDQQDARELLERNADMQQRPDSSRGNRWKITKPEIDW